MIQTLLIGMAMQAVITGVLSEMQVIRLSAGQQFCVAGVLVVFWVGIEVEAYWRRTSCSRYRRKCLKQEAKREGR